MSEADVGDDGDVRSRHLGELPELARVAHSELEHGEILFGCPSR